jgi:hypothetical protein
VVDLTTVITPGAQSLATAMLTDSWGQIRAALARLWARRAKDGTAVAEQTLLDQAGQELELAKQQAVSLAGEGAEAERAARMELFLAGYLAGQIAARPELAAAVGSLPALLHAEASKTVPAQNTVSGTVHGNVVQAGGDIAGDITFR